MHLITRKHGQQRQPNDARLKENDDEDGRRVYRIDCYFRVRRRGKRYYNALAPRCGDQRFLIGRLRACAVPVDFRN